MNDSTTQAINTKPFGRIQPMVSGSELEGEKQPQVVRQLIILDGEVTTLEELFNSLEKKLQPVLNANNLTPGSDTEKSDEKMVDFAISIMTKTKRIQGVNRALSYVINNLEI